MKGETKLKMWEKRGRNIAEINTNASVMKITINRLKLSGSKKKLVSLDKIRTPDKYCLPEILTTITTQICLKDGRRDTR